MRVAAKFVPQKTLVDRKHTVVSKKILDWSNNDDYFLKKMVLTGNSYGDMVAWKCNQSQSSLKRHKIFDNCTSVVHQEFIPCGQTATLINAASQTHITPYKCYVFLTKQTNCFLAPLLSKLFLVHKTELKLNHNS